MRGLARWFGRELLSREAGEIAKGKRGDFAQDIYWALAGRKRVIAWILWVLAYVAAALAGVACDPYSAAFWTSSDNCQKIMWGSELLQALAGLLMAAGIIDKDWRSPAQKLPEAFAGATAYATVTGAVLYGINATLLLFGAEWAQQAQIALERVLIPALVVTGVASVPARMAQQRS